MVIFHCYVSSPEGNSLLLNMTIEIVDLPMKNGVIFHIVMETFTGGSNAPGDEFRWILGGGEDMGQCESM